MGFRRNVSMVIEPPPFDVERERDKRRERVLAADRALSISVEALKTFQSEHYAIGGHGRLVPKPTVDSVSNEAVDRKHQELVRNISKAHDAFQKALKEWNEL